MVEPWVNFLVGEGVENFIFFPKKVRFPTISKKMCDSLLTPREWNNFTVMNKPGINLIKLIVLGNKFWSSKIRKHRQKSFFPFGSSS